MPTAHPQFLLIDDDPADREGTMRMLEVEFPGCKVKQVTGRSEFEAALAQSGYDLVITDDRLRWSRGLDVLRAVRARSPGCPVLVLAGERDPDVAVEALRAGASDCIVKGQDYTSLLRASAWRALEQAHQAAALEEAERALRESERRYRHITEAVTDYIFTVRIEDGQPVDTIHGQNSEVVTGYTSAEFAADPYLWINMVPEAHRAAVRDQAARLLAGGGHSSLEHRIVRKDGEVRWVRNTLVPQHDAQGTLVSYDGLIRDITGRKQADAALRESEERFRNLTEHIPVSIQGYRTDGVVVYWNKASEDMYGYTAQEAIGRNLADLIVPPDLLPLWKQALHEGTRATHSGEFLPAGDLRLLHRDGHRVPVHSIHTAVCSQGNDPMLFCIDVDLSERKKAEETVAAAARQWQHTFDAIEDLVAVIDREHRVVQANKAMREFFGHDDIIGTPCYRLFHGTDAPPKHGVSFLAFQGAGAAHVELQEPHLGDRKFDLYAYPVADEQGDTVQVVHVVRDITEQRQLEEQFHQSQKMEAVGQLAGGIAHDFNNLLTAISGYTEMALDRLTAGAPLHHDISQVKRAADRAASLTRQLLAFSRHQVLRPTVIDLGTVVADMSKILRRVIGEDIRLVTTPCPTLGRVKADQSQIESVIMNLAVNARDAMPRGGTLTIDTANVDLDAAKAHQCPDIEPGPYVRLSVADTGTGMDDETLAHVFEPFFTTKKPGKGTGLGLSTVHGIIKQSGGHTEAHSTLGKGTTIDVFLPRVADTPDTPPAGPPAQTMRGTETILLVEDEDVVRDLAHTILAQQGYTIIEAHDGVQALQLCEQHAKAIDLVVTDIVMPRLDGRQLVKRLRTRQPDIRVLYISGYTKSTIRDRDAIDPATTFLPKPFLPDALVSEVRRVLDTPGTAATP